MSGPESEIRDWLIEHGATITENKTMFKIEVTLDSGPHT